MSRSWRKIRVFISSTFRDMSAERDHLVRVVFPELKKLCRAERVELTDIDLRWGVSEQDVKDGKALDICLNEIDSCRPFFVGLLGHRYGWVPSGEDCSITAAEVYHGVLHNDLPGQLVDLRAIIEGRSEGKRLSDQQINCLKQWYPYDGHKRKYILQPGINAGDTEIIRGIFQSIAAYQRHRSFFFFRSERLSLELAKGQPDIFFESGQAEQDKLDALKQAIKDRGIWWTNYDSIEALDEEDTKAFGRKVCNILWERIQADLNQKPEEERDWLDEEREFHDIFVADRTKRFVGREDQLKRIHNFCHDRGKSPILLVCGEPGSGKSALMARFTEQIEHTHPDWLIIPHFVGASPNSSNLRLSLRHIIGEIQRHTKSDVEIPEDINDLISLFPQKLEQVAKLGPTIVVLDAVNQFEQTYDPQDMLWLPSHLPKNLRLLISTLEGPAKDALITRQPDILDMKGLSANDINDLVDKYLKEVRKEFPNPESKDAFLAKLSRGNPLYAIVALEELRVFGNFDSVAQRISDLPDSVSKLFGQVLDRVESDFTRFPGLVKDALCLIACGRQGMASEELQFLLAQHAQPLYDGCSSDKLPDMLLARLRLSLDAYLFNRSGVLDYFHVQLRKAVKLRWLSDELDRLGYHRSIAGYFQKRWKEPNIRALSELPHQRIKSQDWDSVAATLCDLDFLQKKCSAEMVHNLLEDYQAAIETLPENQDAIDREKDFQVLVKEYIKNLRGAKKINENNIIPSFTPLGSESFKAKWQEVQDEPSRLDQINAFYQFIKSESHKLLRLGAERSFFLSNAYNYSDNSPVTQAARIAIDSSVSEPFILSHPLWRQPYNPHPACLMTLEGHTGSVSAVALTPDGLIAISGSADKTLRVWDLGIGRCKIIIEGHTQAINAVALSLDGKMAVTGSDDKTLRVWNIESGHCFKNLKGHDDGITSLALTEDMKRVVTGSKDKTIRVWDIDSESCEYIFSDHNEKINVVAITADGEMAVSGSADGTIISWDLKNGKKLKYLTNMSEVVDLSLSIDGKAMLAVGGDSGCLWDMETGNCGFLFGGYGMDFSAVALTFDGKIAVTATSFKTLSQWELGITRENETSDIYSKLLKMVEGHRDKILSVDLTADGRHAISGSSDKTLKIWDMGTGFSLRRQSFPGYDVLEYPEFEPLRQRGSDYDEGQTGLYELSDLWQINQSTGEFDKNEGLEGSCTALQITGDGKNALLGCDKNYLYLLNLEERIIQKMHAGWSHQTVMCRSPASSFEVALESLALVCIKDVVLLWDLISNKYIADLIGHTDTVNVATFIENAKYIVSGSSDTTLWVFDISGIHNDPPAVSCSGVIRGHSRGINTLAMSTDDRILVSGSEDCTLRVWNMGTGKCLHILEGHNKKINAIAVSSDKKLVVSGSEDKSLRVWDLKSGECLTVLEGHHDSVLAVKLLSKEKHVISKSKDSTYRVWEVMTGKLLGTYSGNSLPAFEIPLTPDGRWLVDSSDNGTIKLHDLETGHCSVLASYEDNITLLSLEGYNLLICLGNNRLEASRLVVPTTTL